MYLYCTTKPGTKFKVTYHTGFAVVYFDADRATALADAQLPSCALFPTIFIVWPTDVVTTSLKVTATDVGQDPEAVVDVVADGIFEHIPLPLSCAVG